jgi:predicted dehydrogenase
LNFNAFRQDRSVLWDLAPHDLSMMIYLLDQLPDSVVSVTGHKTGNDDKVDVGHIELSFPGGIRGHIHNSWIHPTKQVRLMIRGTRRAAVIDDTVAEKKLQIYSVEDTGFKHVVEYPDYLTIEPLKLECQHFVNAIRHGNAPRTDAQNGSDVVRILQLAEQMMVTSGAAPLLQTR